MNEINASRTLAGTVRATVRLTTEFQKARMMQAIGFTWARLELISPIQCFAKHQPYLLGKSFIRLVLAVAKDSPDFPSEQIRRKTYNPD